MAVARQAAWSTRLRSRSNPPRPYMVRFDHLQPADLALDRARRPRRAERGPDGREILPEALGEAPERRPGRGGEPPVQGSRSLLPDQGGETTGETVNLRQGGRFGQQPVEERAVTAG